MSNLARGNKLDCEMCDKVTEGFIRRLIARNIQIDLLPGPDGQYYCQKHHREKWKAEMDLRSIKDGLSEEPENAE